MSGCAHCDDRIRALEAELDATQSTLEASEHASTEMKAHIQRLEAELAEAKEASFAAAVAWDRNVTDLRQEIEQARADQELVEQENHRLQRLRADIKRLEAENAELRRKMSSMRPAADTCYACGAEDCDGHR